MYGIYKNYINRQRLERKWYKEYKHNYDTFIRPKLTQEQRYLKTSFFVLIITLI